MAFPARKLLVARFCAILLTSGLTRNLAAMPDDPWTAAQTVQPAQLVIELQQEKDRRVLVIYVGVKTLYNGGHIPSAVYYGPGSPKKSISDLKKYSPTLPKHFHLGPYCGCCPLEKCPNLRPAFAALKDLGFARLRVLILPTSFNTDWAEKGYPVQKGS